LGTAPEHRAPASRLDRPARGPRADGDAHRHRRLTFLELPRLVNIPPAAAEGRAMSEISYHGARIGDEGRCKVWVEIPGEGPTPLAPRNDLRNHSPDGFEWGYGGSGPAQLALAICTHAAGDRVGQGVYHDFKFAVIARITADVWSMTRQEVLDTIRALIEANR
jgi:hypothetical protein